MLCCRDKTQPGRLKTGILLCISCILGPSCESAKILIDGGANTTVTKHKEQAPLQDAREVGSRVIELMMLVLEYQACHSVMKG